MDLRLFLEEIAQAAGEITLKYFNQPSLEILTKADDSPVTIADRETEQYLRRRIRERFATDVILGEEFGEDGSNASRRWILDPIDGTKSFVHGVPLYGVMIALEEDGKITNGVVHLPAIRETISATHGGGCFWNGQACRVSNVTSIEQATVLTTNFPRIEATLSRTGYKTLILDAGLLRGWGDCYGHILVATGRAEIMLDPKMALWDCAPLGVIVKEAGGNSFDFAGVDTIYSPNLISTNGALADIVKEALNA
jgi:histidinol phosphatase-like enzyme (inositol monophosphatase family)